MSERDFSGCMPRVLMSSDEDDIGMLASLSQACVDLLSTISVIAAYKAVLDAEASTAPNHAVSNALDTIRASTRTCRKLAAAIIGMTPGSAVEESLRSQALAAYLALFDVDELIRSLHFDVSSTLFKDLMLTGSYAPSSAAALFNATGSSALSLLRHPCDAKCGG